MEKIIFGAGITPDKILINISGTDVTYTVLDGNDQPTNDKMTIVNGLSKTTIEYISIGTTIEYWNGANGDDYIDGGDGPDVIHGFNGNDTLIGGNNDDKLYGGNGNNYLY